ncbi:MAG TPA: GDP-mannose 4,6-dehydratase [Polyangiaceae bacterium]|jgi:GDP-4-dehydro-6-deoxy-D-mannose reductase
MRVLVTGADSFIGSHLTEALVAAGDEVIGTSRKRDGFDVTDASKVAAVVRDAKPDRVFHLAAQSNIPKSFADPATTMAVNVVGSANLFEAIRVHAPDASVVSVGSAAEYGDSARDAERIAEDARLRPTSPYGASKVAQSSLVSIYARAHKTKIVHVRLFAILGTRKDTDALADFSRNVVAIERGKADALTTGNTTALRDFTDVRDAVAGLVIAANAGVPGDVYNLCRGEATSLDDLIALLERASGRKLTVKKDPARLRPVDDPRVVGDPSKLRALGFSPRFQPAETVAAVLDYWRARG